MRKRLCKLLKAIAKTSLSISKYACRICLFLLAICAKLLKWISIFVVAILLAAQIAGNPIPVVPGIPTPSPIVGSKQIHEIIPHTRWSHLRPCGAYLDEQEEFAAARQCVNSKVPLFKKKPVPQTALVPRCFVITTDSPNVLQGPSHNAIPIIDIFRGRMGGILGFYDSSTQTVYVVENVDVAQIYRHELQHHFQHITGHTVNHEGEVWNKCEPPLYEPSKTSILVHRLLNQPTK